MFIAWTNNASDPHLNYWLEVKENVGHLDQLSECRDKQSFKLGVVSAFATNHNCLAIDVHADEWDGIRLGAVARHFDPRGFSICIDRLKVSSL